MNKMKMREFDSNGKLVGESFVDELRACHNVLDILRNDLAPETMMVKLGLIDYRWEDGRWVSDSVYFSFQAQQNLQDEEVLKVKRQSIEYRWEGGAWVDESNPVSTGDFTKNVPGFPFDAKEISAAHWGVVQHWLDPYSPDNWAPIRVEDTILDMLFWNGLYGARAGENFRRRNLHRSPN